MSMTDIVTIWMTEQLVNVITESLAGSQPAGWYTIMDRVWVR